MRLRARPADRPLLALKDAAGINAYLAHLIGQVRSVAHEAAGFDVLSRAVDRRELVMYRQRGELHPASDDQRRGPQ